jgi:opacity protein-like surface antigen
MFPKASLIPVALVALGGAGAASAADQGQWVTSFMAGSQFLENGSFNPHATSEIADLGTIDPPLAGLSGQAHIDQLQFHDAFRVGPSFSLETGYMAQSNIEPFVRLSYSQLDGRNQEVGILDSASLDSPVPIRANIGDMNTWALNLGTRYFLTDSGAARTYLAGYIGADRTDALHARIHVAGMPETASEDILPQTTRFDAGVEGGVAWQVSDNADLSLSLGAQYLDARSEDTNAFAPVGVQDVRFTDQRWSFPVNFGVSFKF